jgi:hypothetical protein
MPSIEIACQDLLEPLSPPETSFFVMREPGLKSHRSPRPRFQTDFDELRGSLYHIVDTQDSFNAYQTLSEGSRHGEPSTFLEFDREHLKSVHDLIHWLLGVSPCKRLLFTSDWQFGPEWTKRYDPMTVDEFWRLHDSKELLLNAAYPIHGAA